MDGHRRRARRSPARGSTRYAWWRRTGDRDRALPPTVDVPIPGKRRRTFHSLRSAVTVAAEACAASSLVELRPKGGSMATGYWTVRVRIDDGWLWIGNEAFPLRHISHVGQRTLEVDRQAAWRRFGILAGISLLLPPFTSRAPVLRRRRTDRRSSRVYPQARIMCRGFLACAARSGIPVAVRAGAREVIFPGTAGRGTATGRPPVRTPRCGTPDFPITATVVWICRPLRPAHGRSKFSTAVGAQAGHKSR